MAYETRPIDVVPAQRALQYTGDNSAAIAEHIADFTVNDETATTLTFTSNGQTRSVARDGYISYAGGVVTEVYNNHDDFTDALTALSSVDHIHELTLKTGGALPHPADEA